MSLQLVHREFGGTGEALVLLHGMLGSSRNWQTAGKDLAARYRVYAPDLRNHGGSPHADEMTYQAMVEDVLAWMDRIGLGRAAMLGHSMGGKVAMLLACRHAERVGRLTVVDIVPKDYHWVGHRAEFAAMNQLQLENLHSRAEAEMRMEGLVPDLGMRKFLTTNLERASSGWRWTINLPVLTAALSILEKSSLAPSDCFQGPARFIIGARSNYVQKDDWPLAQRHFPNADFTLLPSGHNPHMDAREAFVAAVP